MRIIYSFFIFILTLSELAYGGVAITDKGIPSLDDFMKKMAAEYPN